MAIHIVDQFDQWPMTHWSQLSYLSTVSVTSLTLRKIPLQRLCDSITLLNTVHFNGMMIIIKMYCIN